MDTAISDWCARWSVDQGDPGYWHGWQQVHPAAVAHGTDPAEALQIAHMVYKSDHANIQAMDVMIAALSEKGRFGKAEVLRIERAKIIRATCHEVLDKLGVNDPLLDIAMKLEEVALKDDYFIEHKLYPNVDFYSGILLKALGIPVDMFTVIFALGRTPGWIAHWCEMLNEPYKIGRPRQLYTGPTKRAFVPIDKRP